MAIQVIREHEAPTISGWWILPIALPLLPVSFLGMTFGTALLSHGGGGALLALAFGAAMFLSLVALKGLFVVQPNEARVLQLFGAYRGTVRATGLRWTNPLYTKSRVSVRVRNFESERLKVNDSEGNPVDIAAVVVWRVSDTAEALFHVDNYQHFVAVQSEAALRNLAALFPYDGHGDDAVALRSHPIEVASQLRDEIQARLAEAGVEVIESRISHLAYAQEIASAMLQRQQANAIVAAREKIVEGAVGMVETALTELARREIVDLDRDRRSELVSNLLVVLCSDNQTTPVVQAGASR